MSIGRYNLCIKLIVCYKSYVKNEMLTTKQVLEALADKGITVSYPTVALWVRKGKFEGAERKEESRGAVWYIPRSSVENFKKPEIGRPAKVKIKR